MRDDPIFDNCEICLPMVGGQDAGLRDEINDEKATFAGADTGIFAASSGVNPMLLCMALADRVASL
ncbi:MAG: hypothetical protein ACPGVG_13410, partial [Mycobacterium sp.]